MGNLTRGLGEFPKALLSCSVPCSPLAASGSARAGVLAATLPLTGSPPVEMDRKVKSWQPDCIWRSREPRAELRTTGELYSFTAASSALPDAPHPKRSKTHRRQQATTSFRHRITGVSSTKKIIDQLSISTSIRHRFLLSLGHDLRGPCPSTFISNLLSSVTVL